MFVGGEWYYCVAWCPDQDLREEGRLLRLLPAHLHSLHQGHATKGWVKVTYTVTIDKQTYTDAVYILCNILLYTSSPHVGKQGQFCNKVGSWASFIWISGDFHVDQVSYFANKGLFREISNFAKLVVSLAKQISSRSFKRKFWWGKTGAMFFLKFVSQNLFYLILL